MADNTTLNPGAGGDTIRDLNRQGGSTKTQVVQLDLGGPAANAENLITGGQQNSANSIPVVIASDQITPQTTSQMSEVLNELRLISYLLAQGLNINDDLDSLRSDLRINP